MGSLPAIGGHGLRYAEFQRTLSRDDPRHGVYKFLHGLQRGQRADNHANNDRSTIMPLWSLCSTRTHTNTRVAIMPYLFDTQERCSLVVERDRERMLQFVDPGTSERAALQSLNAAGRRTRQRMRWMLRAAAAAVDVVLNVV